MELHTLDELRRRVIGIVKKWHKGRRPHNDGEAGNTLEDLLGLKENNLKVPDFGEIEIKTVRIEGGTLITLFHREPDPPASIPRLLECLGWRHRSAGVKHPATEMRFSSTTYGHAYTGRGFRIECGRDRLSLVFDPSSVKLERTDRAGAYRTYGEWIADLASRQPHYSQVMPISFPLQEVIKGFKLKLNHSMLAYYKSRGEAGNREYYFQEVTLMKGFKGDRLRALFEDGSIAVDFDARSGHNHGTKFRVRKSRVRELFSSFASIP